MEKKKESSILGRIGDKGECMWFIIKEGII